jgi:hypothetical protein
VNHGTRPSERQINHFILPFLRVRSHPHQKKIFRNNLHAHPLRNNNNPRRVLPDDELVKMGWHHVPVVSCQEPSRPSGNAKDIGIGFAIQSSNSVRLKINGCLGSKGAMD